MPTSRRLSALGLLLGVGTLLALVCPPQAAAESTTVTCSFSQDDLRIEQTRGFDRVNVKGGVLTGEPGEPWLPVKIVRVSVPAGARFESLRWSATSEALPGRFLVAPAQRPHVVGQPGEWTPPSPAAYAVDALRPGVVAAYNGRHMQRGFTTFSFRVYPLAYNAVRRQLMLRNQVRLEVSYGVPADRPTVHPRNVEFFQKLTEQRVLNPQEVAGNAPDRVAPLSSLAGPAVDALIIYEGAPGTNTAADRLAEWYTAKGYPAETITMYEIRITYEGEDWPAKVRNCIREYVANHGTLFVLMMSDYLHSIRYCYVWSEGAALDGPFVETYTMPTDLYYAGLDGSWDANGNGIYGEAPQDDPPTVSDQVDLDYDVVFARYPVRTVQEAHALIDKVITYETSPPASDFAKRIMFGGIRLWNSYPPGTYNDIYFDHHCSDAEVKSETLLANCIDTQWSSYTCHRLYDTFTTWDTSYPGSYHVTRAHLNEKLSGGYNFFIMSTHGWYDLWACESGNYYPGSVQDLHNADKAGIIQTIACMTAGFDQYAEPCLSEAFLRREDCGAIVYLGCSRYGLGYPDTTQGPSMDYIESFFNMVLGNNIGLAGLAFAESKLALAGLSELNGPHRWLQFGINLQGDPLVDVYTADPQALSPEYTHQIEAGQQAFSVANVPDTARVCLWKSDQVYEVWTGPGAGTIDAGEGEMLLTIAAHNYVLFQDVITVLEPSCPGDFNLDGRRDFIDFSLLSNAYGAHSGEPTYSPVIDMNGDGVVNFTDLTLFSDHYNVACP